MAPRSRIWLMSTTALLLCGSLSGTAAPLGGRVVGGSATISSPSPTTLIINQTSQNAIINWNSFNISTGETVKFIQPNRSSISLDRVSAAKLAAIPAGASPADIGVQSMS